MAKIVVIGAGIGGMSAAYELREALGKAHEITLVGQGPEFGFTPSNPWLAVGWRQRDAITLPVADSVSKKGIVYNGTGAASIEAGDKQVVTGDGTRLDYDDLLICTGPRLAFDEVPGSGPVDGHTQSICTTDHAESAWDAYQAFLKNPGPMVIGAVQGASCFGPAYEFALILDADLRKRKIRDRVPMTFVTSEPYIGHMGLGGVGDSKGLLESELRQRHIKWITNAKVTGIEAGEMAVAEHDDKGEVQKEHKLPFTYSMMLPAFTGVDAVRKVPELCNPRGFVIVDKHQRSPRYPNIFSAGVCVAIPPVEATPVPTGAPKTGFMIESMVTTIVSNIKAEIEGRTPDFQGTWNAVCLADMGDTGMAFVALPQIPPRNVTWTGSGRWVHLAKVGFEKYFLYKMRRGTSEPVFEKYVMKALGIERLKAQEASSSK